VLVHLDNSSPVLGDLGQVKGLGKVDQVEDILLETRSTETLLIRTAQLGLSAMTYDRGLQELGTHSRVLSDGESDFVNVGSGSLTDGGQGVDGRDSLSQHGIGSELGKLR